MQTENEVLGINKGRYILHNCVLNLQICEAFARDLNNSETCSPHSWIEVHDWL